nr:MAG TPA: hypothetical protein [Caudoviricetes sp.]
MELWCVAQLLKTLSYNVVYYPYRLVKIDRKRGMGK